MSSKNPVKSGRFYSIFESSDYLVMEDLTKWGLNVSERYFDNKYGAECDSGTIYDGAAEGIVFAGIFPNQKFTLDEIVRFAEDMNQRYLAIREMTCPDD